MKRIIYLSVYMLCCLLFSCQSDEQELSNVGYLTLSVGQDISTDTKAPVDGYTGKQIGVQIVNSKNVVVKETDNWEDWKTTPIELQVGTYTIKASSVGFDGSEAAWEAPYYAASQEVTIAKNKTASVKMTCTLANVKVTVHYEKDLLDAFQSVAATVNDKPFPSTETKSCYFPVGKLTAEVTLISKSGTTYSKKNNKELSVDRDAKARDHYIFNYKLAESGNGNVTVKVDPTTNKYEYTFTIGKLEKDCSLSANAWSNFAYFTAADISGTTADMALKFQYRKKGEEAWTDVAAKPDGKNYITDKITGLTPATTYEYQLVGTANETTSIIGRVATFTTETNIVLQNGGFEDWHQNGKIWYAASESDFKGGNYLWDSSNPGGGAFGYNPTTGDASVKRTGSYSAKLESQYAVVKFAAASLYYGRFNDLIGVSGAKIDFGQPFKSRPTALHGFYQYVPMQIDNVGKGQPANTVKKGDMDICSIYIALSKKKYTVDNTNPSTFINFESDENIIAYGELPAADCVNTNGEWKEFTINLKYKNITDKPLYLIIVCSSSKYGDYFTGGVGSCLHLDDFELLYGDTPTMWK